MLARNELDEALKSAGLAQNASLLLAAYAPMDLLMAKKEAASDRLALVERIIALARPGDGYRLAHAERVAWVAEWPGPKVCLTVRVAQGGLAIGTGYPTALGQGIALHRLYGVPTIPGSSLKGVLLTWLQSCPDDQVAHWFDALSAADAADAAAVAGVMPTGPQSGGDDAQAPCILDMAQKRQFLAQLMLGDTAHAAWIELLDAWPHPDHCALHQDIITPHHGRYFRHECLDSTEPEEPIPVPFLVASGQFSVTAMVHCAPGRLADALCTWVRSALRAALTRFGVGAKTHAGYGALEEVL